MAVDLNDLKSIFQEFLGSSKAALLEVQEQTQMEDEYFATAVAQIISNAMSSSVQALDVISGIAIKSAQSAKDLLVKDAQIGNENASKDLKIQQKTSMIAEDTIKSAQSAKDLLVKDAQIGSENASKDLKIQQKTSMIAEDTIKSAQSAKDLLVKDAQKDLLVEQKNSATKTALLAVRQTTALDDAKRVKKAQILGETISMIQSGGITPPAQMQADFTGAIAAI